MNRIYPESPGDLPSDSREGMPSDCPVLVMGINPASGLSKETAMALLDEVHEILDPGVDRIEDGKHPDIGDAMNLLGRVVAALEHVARTIDEQNVVRG
jgi:hypothetical protein